MTDVSSISSSAYVPPPAPAPAPQQQASTDNANAQAQQQAQAATAQPVYSAINNANASTIRGSGVDLTA